MNGVAPVPDRDALRIIAATVLGVGAAVAVPLLGLPESTEPIMKAGCIVIAFTLVWGNRIRQALDVIGILRGP